MAQSDSTARNYYMVYRDENQLTSQVPQFAYFVSPSSNALKNYLNKALVLGYDLESVVQVEESEARRAQSFDNQFRVFNGVLDVFCLGTVPLFWVQPPPPISARR